MPQSPRQTVPKEKVPPLSKSPRKKRRGGDDEDSYYGGRERRLQKPEDQEKLTEAELKEEFVRSLTTYDGVTVQNVIIWNYKTKSFVNNTSSEPCVFLLTLASEMLSKDGTEIKEVPGAQLMDDDSDKEVKPGFERPVVVKKVTQEPRRSILIRPEDRRAQGEGAAIKALSQESIEEDIEEEHGGGDTKPMKILSQFKHADRSTQTTNNKVRNHSVQTEPPLQLVHNDYCNYFIIYDAYQAEKRETSLEEHSGMDFGGGEETRINEDDDEVVVEKKPIIIFKKEKEVKFAEKEKVNIRKASIIEGQGAIDMAYLKSGECLRFLERLVGVNMFEDVVYDFKYFEDNSDGYRENGEGTVLPLWRFLYDKAKKKHVTCISWSESQPDLFAVSYGSFSFIHPVHTGLVVLYSLRNYLFPEHIWQREKGVLCCHIHPRRNCLVCVGLSDGNVAALNLEKDLRNETQSEVYGNTAMTLKHSAPVWSVKWSVKDDLDDHPMFYSAGMDGKIILWTIGLPPESDEGIGQLIGTEVTRLTLPQPAVKGPDGTTFKMFGCARCITFHPVELTTLLVGTAEGKIFISSSLYGNKLIRIFDAHFLPVAAVQWNPYHYDIFISCSEDWTIKVWDRRDLKPLFTFETGVPIMDVCWAPYSSSVFGGITLEGKLLIYDLNVSRENPICMQQVATKKKIHPHRMQFNPEHPIVVVGDDRGSLLTLKLSPNLRIVPKDANGNLLEGEKKFAWEVSKLTRILQLVRDPSLVSNPKPDDLPLLTNLSEIPGQLSLITN